MNILQWLEKQNRELFVFGGFIFIGVIGFLDYLTGNDFSFSIFYVIPILIITWLTNQRTGFIASFASAVAWLAADVAASQVHSPSIASFWNSLIRLSFFMIITLLLSSLK